MLANARLEKIEQKLQLSPTMLFISNEGSDTVADVPLEPQFKASSFISERWFGCPFFQPLEEVRYIVSRTFSPWFKSSY